MTELELIAACDQAKAEYERAERVYREAEQSLELFRRDRHELLTERWRSQVLPKEEIGHLVDRSYELSLRARR